MVKIIVVIIVIIIAISIIANKKEEKGCKGCVNDRLTKGISCDTCVNHCNYLSMSKEEFEKEMIEIYKQENHLT